MVEWYGYRGVSITQCYRVLRTDKFPHPNELYRPWGLCSMILDVMIIISHAYLPR